MGSYQVQILKMIMNHGMYVQKGLLSRALWSGGFPFTKIKISESSLDGNKAD